MSHSLLPLVKHAYIAGAADTVPRGPFFLDAMVNEGFSGGPVYRILNGGKAFAVCMVISSYLAVSQPIIDRHGDPTGHFVHANSGIGQAYNISHALKLIQSNPIGFPL